MNLFNFCFNFKIIFLFIWKLYQYKRINILISLFIIIIYLSSLIVCRIKKIIISSV